MRFTGWLALAMLWGCGTLTPLGDGGSGMSTPPPSGAATGTTYPSIPASCGDGVVDEGEICDDGGESAQCDVDCTPAECGDNRVNATAGEACDTAGDSEDCDADCTPVECGDEYVNSVVEVCESQGVDRPTCDADCTAVECGDGYANNVAQEACDDAGMSALCDDDCTLAECGDSLVNSLAGEDCDDGFYGSATCDDDCTPPICGDGTLNTLAGETCDDGNLVDYDGCDSLCQSEMPAVCTTGLDPITSAEWVVCGSSPTSLWVSHGQPAGGTFRMDLICQSLGYPNVTQNGGTCGSVCGYCDGAATSCSSPGTRSFDGSNGCAFPQACTTVTWECSI